MEATYSQAHVVSFSSTGQFARAPGRRQSKAALTRCPVGKGSLTKPAADPNLSLSGYWPWLVRDGLLRTSSSVVPHWPLPERAINRRNYCSRTGNPVLPNGGWGTTCPDEPWGRRPGEAGAIGASSNSSTSQQEQQQWTGKLHVAHPCHLHPWLCCC